MLAELTSCFIDSKSGSACVHAGFKLAELTSCMATQLRQTGCRKFPSACTDGYYSHMILIQTFKRGYSAPTPPASSPVFSPFFHV